MRKWLCLLGVVVAGFAAPAARAADEPTVTVRVRSLNDLLDRAEYLAGLGGQAEAGKQVVQLARGLTDDKKGLEGFDPSRPVGAYGYVNPGVVDSTAVVVLPVADESAVVELLTGRLNLNPKKGDGGVYEIKVPNVPVPVFFRFANKSVYVTAVSANPLADKALLDPKVLFAEKDEAVAAVRIHFDRVPATVRKTVLGQLELQIAQRKEKAEPGETPGQAKLRKLALDALMDAAAALLNDGRQFSLRFLIVPSSDDLSAEVMLSAKSGTPLDSALRGIGSAAGLPSLGGKMPLLAAGLRWSVPKAYRERLNGAIDDLVNEAVAKAEPGAEEAAQTAADAITPTLQGNELDAAVAMIAPDDGKPRLVFALRTKEGSAIEKLFKQFAPFIPEDQVKFEFDRETVSGVKIHKSAFGEAKLRPIFGTDSVWIGTSDSRLIVSVEPEPKLIREAAKAGEAKAPLFAAEASVGRLIPLVDDELPKDEAKKLAVEVFPGGAAEKDTVAVSITGGDSLTVKVTVKGLAVKFLAAIDKAKKEQ